ncbi:MAG TPA: serine hydrolase domain-containing protein [Candidatus Binatia bacterium]|nr:serine hydrolase domain-containing protein [Candidatus Binatia bacterium]
MGWAAVEDALDEAVKRGVFPGAVLLVSRAGEVVLERAVGSRSIEPERAAMRPEVVFDLSSLTKPLATTLAFLLLVKERRVAVDDRVTRYFHNFGVHGKGRVTFRHLLTHSSGLAAHRPFYKDIARLERQAGRLNFVASRGAKEWVFEQIHREKLEAEPGTKVIYSDLGFMLLGQVVETITRQTLDRFCHSRIYGPLGLRALSFIDLTQMRARRIEPVSEMIAATARCPWRKRILCGEVDDDNAYAMGGVAGHAGLFGSARDVDALATALEKAGRGEHDLLPRELVQAMWTLDETVPGSTRTLGWDTPSPRSSSAGSRMSPRTVGHLGFTGVSLWMDLEREVHVVLLTNRVHPSRDNDRLAEFRPRIHDLVMEGL